MAKLFVVTRTPKADPDDWQVVGQTTNEEIVPWIVWNSNNNNTFIKKAGGGISGDQSSIEVFKKDELGAAFSQTVNLDDQE